MGICADMFHSTDANAETLFRRIRPNKEQEQFIQEKWNRLADWLRDHYSRQFGASTSTWLQGSYKFGTLVRPLCKGHDFDVDMGFYVDSGDGVNPKDQPAATLLRNRVRDGLMAYKNSDADAVSVDWPKERCERIHFQHDFHIDVPCYRLVDVKDARWLATQTHAWEDSDPKAIYKWFKDKVENPERAQIRRFVCYLKSWVALAYQRETAQSPSSIMMTVLTTEVYVSASDELGKLDEEDAFVAFLDAVAARLRKSASVNNPIDPSENLNRLSKLDMARFVNLLDRLRTIAKMALSSKDVASAALTWTEAFSHFFPPVPIDEAKLLQEAAKLPARIEPQVGIQVFDPNKRSLGGYSNAVPIIQKNATLVFSLSNAAAFGTDAEVEWVVRNTGSEAEAVNDLGHSRRLLSGRSVEERTLYAGKQYMDCIVRRDGRIVAFRRVPVVVGTRRL